MLNLILKSSKNKIHNFCTDYGSAILVNILSDNDILEAYQKSPKESLDVKNNNLLIFFFKNNNFLIF